MPGGLQWNCTKCGEWLWNHYENCASCGEARPVPQVEEHPADVDPLEEVTS